MWLLWEAVVASRGRYDVHLADADYISTYIISLLGTAYSIESFPLKSAHVIETSSGDFEADNASVNFILNRMTSYSQKTLW